jgi:UPF0755 protein
MRKIFTIIVTLLLIAGACAIALIGAGYYLNTPVEIGSEEMPAEGAGNADDVADAEDVFQVNHGEAVRTIAARLADEGYIRSQYFLVAVSKLKQTQSSIKSGYYRISGQMTTIEVHDLLVAGNQKLMRVTIPEGLTARATGRRFEEAGICGQSDFLEAVYSKNLLEEYSIESDSAEGFLYPDTYLFQQDFPAEKVVKHLVETLFEKLQELYPEYTQLEWEELNEKIILASIVEREYRDPDEAAKIASVFYNRLEKRMRLQSCATVVYVLTEVKGKDHPKKLSYSDLEVDSEYNTYQQWGLPPAPIANPGVVALDAAFYPADTDYLYFLLKDPNAGSHVFSKTLTDHNRAYRLYIKQ